MLIFLIHGVIGPWVLAFLGLLLAFLIGWFIRGWRMGSKISYWRSLFEDKEHSYNGLEVDYNGSVKKAKGLEQDVYRLENKLPALNEEILGLQGNVTDRDRIIAEFKEQDWENRYNGVKFDLDKRNDEYTKLQALVDPKDKEIEEWKRKYTTSDASVSDLNTQIKEWKTKYDNVTPDLKKAEDEVGKLKVDMVSKNTLIEELRAKIKNQVELQNSYDKLQTDFNGIQPQVEVLKGKETELEEKLANCRGKSDQLQTTNGDLLREVEELKAKLNAKPDVDVDGLNNEISRLKAELDQSKSGFGSLQSSNANLTAQLAAAKADTGANDAMQAELDKLRAELQTSKDDYNKLNAKNSKFEATAKKIEATEDETQDDKINKIKSKAGSIDFSRIGTGEGESKDDLTKIKLSVTIGLDKPKFC